MIDFESDRTWRAARGRPARRSRASRVRERDAALERRGRPRLRLVPASATARATARRCPGSPTRRTLYKALGIDPTKTRPSNEALLRRALKGETLYRINTLVDALNLVSLREQLPVRPLRPRSRAAAGRAAQGRSRARPTRASARGPVNVEGRPVLVDADGSVRQPDLRLAAHLITLASAAGARRRVRAGGLSPPRGSSGVLDATAETLTRFCGGTPGAVPALSADGPRALAVVGPARPPRSLCRRDGRRAAADEPRPVRLHGAARGRLPDQVRACASCPPREAKLADVELVIGVVVGAEARAYPVNLMWGPESEALNDTLGGVPVVATWCPIAHSAVVVRAHAAGRALDLGPSGSSGASSSSTTARRDRSGARSRASPRAGREKGSALRKRESMLTTWATWRRLHPDTTVYFDETLPNHHPFDDDTIARITLAGDGPLRNEDLVAGCRGHGVARARGCSGRWAPGKALNDATAGEPVVVFLAARRGHRARDCAAASPAGCSTFAARRQDDRLRDAETGSELGRAHRPRRLRPARRPRASSRSSVTTALWYAWSSQHPGTTLWGGEPPRPRRRADVVRAAAAERPRWSLGVRGRNEAASAITSEVATMCVTLPRARAPEDATRCDSRQLRSGVRPALF